MKYNIVHVIYDMSYIVVHVTLVLHISLCDLDACHITHALYCIDVT